MCAGLGDIKWRFNTLPGYPDFLEECPRGIACICIYIDMFCFADEKATLLRTLRPARERTRVHKQHEGHEEKYNEQDSAQRGTPERNETTVTLHT